MANDITFSKTSGTGNDTVSVNTGVRFSPKAITKNYSVKCGNLTRNLSVQLNPVTRILFAGYLKRVISNGQTTEFPDLSGLFGSEIIGNVTVDNNNIFFSANTQILPFRSIKTSDIEDTPLEIPLHIRWSIGLVDTQIALLCNFGNDIGLMFQKVSGKFTGKLMKSNSEVDSGTVYNPKITVDIKFLSSAYTRYEVILGNNEKNMLTTYNFASPPLLKNLLGMFGSMFVTDCKIIDYDISLINDV